MEYVTAEELADGADEITRSPRDDGAVKLIVRRPGPKEREVVVTASLDLTDGLVGDTWRVRRSRRTPDHSPNPKQQLTMMNARAAALIAGDDARWKLAGDQLYVDLDLSEANLPPGTRLAVGSAVIEITDQSHLGCQKFRDRFGDAAFRFVNSPVGRRLRLRGANATIVRAGRVSLGDALHKLPDGLGRDTAGGSDR